MSDGAIFAAICDRESKEAEQRETSGINTRGEKRLHRILKEFYGGAGGAFEVPVGRYLADAAVEDTLFEIQTGPLGPLLPKLRYYLEETDYYVVLVHPVYAARSVIRMDRESGEVLRSRTIRRGGRAIDALGALYPVAELLRAPRVSVQIPRVCAEEYRYSEAVRYRRSGRYEREVFPRALEEIVTLGGAEDYRCFLPPAEAFSAAEYGAWSKLKNRDLYSALNTLCTMGLLSREKCEGKYMYRKQD